MEKLEHFVSKNWNHGQQKFAPVTIVTCSENDWQELRTSINGFGIEFLREMLENPDFKDENIFFSPVSVAYLLSMLEEPAANLTLMELQTILGHSGALNDPSVVLANFKTILTNLNAIIRKEKQLKLTFGSLVFSSEDFGINSRYRSKMNETFDTDFVEFDVEDQNAKSRINEHIDERSNGQIVSILDQIDPKVDCLFVSTSTLKAHWLNKFSKKATRTRNFAVPSHPNFDLEPIEAMVTRAKVDYYNENGNEVISLPLKGNLSMMIIMPPILSSINRFIATEDLCQYPTRNFQQVDAMLYVPKFKIDTRFDINDIISNMGAPTVFSPIAEFSKFSDKNPAVIKALHRSLFQVNEDGGDETSPEGPDKFNESAYQHIAINRPFLFIIGHEKVSNFLFMGIMKKV